jgi:HD domain-containing protein
MLETCQPMTDKTAMQDTQLENMRVIGTATARSSRMEALKPMPGKPTLIDIFTLRMDEPKFGLPFAAGHHGAQCASLAMKAGVDEETVLACLLHDIAMALMRPDHGWWGAQLVAPYVSERISWAIRYHQALRYFPDPENGYEYPEMYVQMFGPDYKPPQYIQTAYREARAHRWYLTARHITMYDDYSFDPTAPFSMEPFVDIIGRHFRQPREGLGNDGSATAHMWRTMIDPNKPL